MCLILFFSLFPDCDRTMDDDYSDDEEADADDNQNYSRLLEPPVSFSQRQTPGYARSPGGGSTGEAHTQRLSTPKTSRTTSHEHKPSNAAASAPRRRLSSSYTPLDSGSPLGAGPSHANTWSGAAKQVQRRRSSSSEKPASPAELMSIFHQHTILYPDECIPASWAGGCSLKEAAEVTSKLENLLIVAERSAELGAYAAKISDHLRRTPGLLSMDAFQYASGPLTRGGAGGESKALAPASAGDSSLYASPQRFIGSDRHGLLTPKGREELLSGEKRCQVNGVKHR
jgi:hypothetical protein